MRNFPGFGGKKVWYVLLLIALLVFWLPSDPAKAAVSHVQSGWLSNNNSSTSIVKAFTSANTAGNAIVVAASFDSANGTAWSCSDSQSNIYAQAVFANDTSHNQALGICYALNIKSGANTVTVTFGGQSQSWRRLVIAEYSGVVSVAALDGTASNIGVNSTAVTTNNLTTSQNGDLIFGVVIPDSGSTTTITAGAGFTIRQTNGDLAIEDQIQTNPGAIAATFTMGVARDYLAQAIALKASNGTPPPPDTTSPSVSMTAPGFGATVAGTTVAVSANASDNVGVVGVQFLLDGNNLGAEDLTSPYSITWNTTTASNGSHTLSARARDAAGNTSNAITNVNVTVDNQGPTGSIAINNNASAVNTRNVTLNLSATDAFSTVTQMRISNTTSFPAAETYATTKAWTLTNGTGTKTVNVQFKDALGNWSPTFSDTIVYETTAPTISGVSATNITNSSATINWTTNEPATSQVEYGLTTSYGQLSPLDTNLLTAHSVQLSNLASQTTYNYRALSRDAAGNLRTGSNNTFITLSGPDTTPPTVPTGLAATPVSTSQINLAWNASTDNVGVIGYDLFRDGNLIVSQSSRNYSDTGLSAATTYSYTVLARDAAGNTSAQSAPVNGTTQAPDTTPPTVSISAPANNATVSNVVSVTANASDNVGVAGVQFKLDGNNLNIEDASAPYSTNWDTTIVPNGSHTLTAIASDAAGNTTTSSPITVLVNNTGGQSGFQNEILVTDLDFPTTLQFLPDGSFIVGELNGIIKRVLPGQTQAEPTPFMTITNIGSAGGLQGLMDIELDPNFATNRYFYVFYTLGSPNFDRLSRFTMDPSGTTASLSSEVVIYQDTVSSGTDHHGGAIVFGNDGKLYVTVGEHFISSNSQNLNNPRGKVLRYNPDGTVPTDNPFFDGAGPNYDAIWAYGLRNPFRMTVDVPTGRIFVADVGGNSYETAREEINILSRGVNYHWPNCEGACGGPGNPVYDYSHYVPGSTTQTRDASVTGGIVYRGSQFPAEYYGNYFFGDYTQNWIRRLTFDGNNNFTGMQFFEPADGSLDTPNFGAPVHLDQGPDGALYYTDIGWENESQITGGKIRRIKYNPGNLAPVAAASGDPLTGLSPLTVNFSSVGSSDPENQPLSYLWNFGDGQTSTQANPQHTYDTNGQFTVRLTVSDEVLSTLSDPIVVRVGNAPQVNILTPNNGLVFRADDTINFSGSATDTEDGTLPASAYSWQIFFHHNTHVHPTVPYTGVTNGSYHIETSGHDYSGNTNYEIVLTATDSDGLQTSQSVFVYPDKVNLTFDTQPAGLTVNIDGQPHVTPFVYDTLKNFTHLIQAPNQSSGPDSYTFASWSDSGAQSHTITAPDTAQTYTANFSVDPSAPFVFAQSNGALGDGSGTSLAAPLTNVTAGSLIVVYVKWEGTPTAVTVSDGTNSYTADAINSASNNDLHAQFFYLPASVATGNVTYTATFGSARTWRRVVVYRYTYGGTVVFDTSNRATGTSGSLNTGNITTTGNNEMVFAAYGEYNSNITTNERINNLPADHVYRNSVSMWDKFFNAPFTGPATATGNSAIWIGNVIAFKK